MRKKPSKKDPVASSDEAVKPPVSPKSTKSNKRSDKTPASPDKNMSVEDFNKMLRDALIEHADCRSRTTNNYLDAVCSVVEEFLQSFVIIGYSMDGEPVTIVNALTPRDADALSAAINRFFMQHNHKFNDYDDNYEDDGNL